MEDTGAKVKSLAKALALLECFTTQEPELGVTQIAEKLDINKSNAHNIITTFQQFGYVDKLPSGKYALGLKSLEFAFIINQHLGYPKAVYDILADIAEQTQEIVYFGLPYGPYVLYLYVVHPISKMKVLPYRDMLGEKAFMYCTGIGKAMLANMPEELWPELIPSERPRFTPNTMTNYDEIVEELQRTKRRGYALDNVERDPDVRCVGVPVYNAMGNLVAGVSTSGTVASMTDEKLLYCSKILIEASARMRDRIYR